MPTKEVKECLNSTECYVGFTTLVAGVAGFFAHIFPLPVAATMAMGGGAAGIHGLKECCSTDERVRTRVVPSPMV